jgi:poly-gamma-glutamate capsule biosynthesis protein CapA/YwtB (metallophosphatase superfamily)
VRSRRSPRAGSSSLAAILGVVGVVGFLLVASSLGPDQPTGSPSPTLPIALGTFPLRSAPADSLGPEDTADAGSPPAPTSDTANVAIVPVTSFRNPWTSTSAAEVAQVAQGSSGRYHGIELLGPGAGPVATLIGLATTGAPAVLLAPDAATVRADLAAHPDRLGFLPAGDVDPSVRALGWEGDSLFGVRRLATADGWPLTLPAGSLPADVVPAAAAGYDPATAWTLVAGGDINLDGGVAYHVKQLGHGVDWPFAGGTASITGHTCCSFAGLPLPVAKRTGNAGAVKQLLSLADLSLANFENPAPDNFTYHPAGFNFSADPALIEGLSNAGIDWVSLANNHIGNAGAQGILDTLANLDTWGIAHGGAEANLDAAREATLLDAGGITVGILGYDTIKPAYAATASKPGSNEMSAARVSEDVAAARAAGAQLVIVFPHWGTEYSATTTATQQRLAHAAVDAGADLVIGSHTHWAGGIEVYKGRPIFYSLGDFVFNIQRSEQTEESYLLELTFSGTRLVQVALHPFLILDQSQPNLLDPAGSGKVVLRQVFGASPSLPW